MTKGKDPQTMECLLADYGDSSLRRIVRQAQRLLAIERIVKPCLPENLRTHCQALQTTATRLTLAADSAAWLTHLRYLKPQLLKQLRKHPQFAYLQEIQLQIQPPAMVPETPTKPRAGQSLSPENKELLQTTAATVSHPLLKKALLQLVR